MYDYPPHDEAVRGLQQHAGVAPFFQTTETFLARVVRRSPRPAPIERMNPDALWADPHTHESLHERLATREIAYRSLHHDREHPTSMAERYAEIGQTLRAGIGETSYSEREAFFAATTILRGDVNDLVARHATDALVAAVRRVTEIVPSFPVPNFVAGNPPFVLDQLWLVLTPDGRGMRRIALEIQGEPHFTEQKRGKDEQRSAYLEKLGYEVVELAGWWCRIDPFRVITAELDALGLVEVDFRADFLGPAPARIVNYVCARCRFPMVRFDPRDIRLDPAPEFEPDLRPRRFIHDACMPE